LEGKYSLPVGTFQSRVERVVIKIKVTEILKLSQRKWEG
jgi:hypothetical protein